MKRELTLLNVFDHYLLKKEEDKNFTRHNKYDLIHREIAEEIEYWDIYDFEHLRRYKMPNYLEFHDNIKGEDAEYRRLKFKLKCYKRMNEVCITGKNKYN